MRNSITSTVVAASLMLLLPAGAAVGGPGHGGGTAATGAAVNTGARATVGAAPAQTTGAPTTLSPHHVTGQPNQSCGSASAPLTPGNAASAGGSAFNPNGVAGGVYAGQQTQNSRNTASVSQYDAACAHQK